MSDVEHGKEIKDSSDEEMAAVVEANLSSEDEEEDGRDED